MATGSQAQGFHVNPHRAGLVGRDHETGRLQEMLNSAGRGEGGLVFISGEPGIGKTRLLREFAIRANAAGWIVLAGSAYETEGMPPYLPFAEALRGYTKRPPTEQAEVVFGLVRSELAMIVPEFGDSGPLSAGIPGDMDRYRLFESVSGLFLNLSSQTEAAGVLLCLDDLHWADPSTLLLVQHIARRLIGHRLLLAGAYRTEDVDQSRPFFSLLADLRRERLDERIQLKPLTFEQTVGLIRASDLQLDQATIEAIYRQTRGNPFFIEEVLRDLSSGDTPPFTGGALAVPQGVREVVGKRLSRLQPEAQRLLQAGAVLGDGFLFEVAAAMIDVDEQTLMDALDQTVNARLLYEQGELCRFGHPLIQRTVYDSLTVARRRALHLRAAKALETAFGSYPEPYLSPLAVNYRLAGSRADPGKTVDYSVRAGSAAEKALAYEEAAVHWKAALDLMERYAFDSVRRADLLASMGDLMQVVGFDKYGDGVGYFEQAIALYEEAGQPDKAAEVQARLGLLLAAGWPGQDNAKAFRYLRAAEEFLQGGPPSEAQLWLYSGLGLVGVWQVRPIDGLSSSRRAMQLATQVGREDRWVTNAVMCGYHLHALGKLREGMQLLERASERANAVNQTYPAFVAASWLSGRLSELGDPLEAAIWCEGEASQRRQAEAPSRRQALWLQTATMKAMSGDLATSASLEARERLTPGPDLSFYNGDWQAALAGWDRSRATATASGNRSQLANACLNLARLPQMRLQPDKVLPLLVEALQIGLDGPHHIIQLRASAGMALMLAWTDHLDESEQHLRRCSQVLAAGEDWRGIAGRIELAEAVLALAMNSHAAAEAHFEQAVDIFRRMSLPWEEAEAFELWAQAGVRYLLGRNRRTFLTRNLELAEGVYQRIGASQPWFDRLHEMELSAGRERPISVNRSFAGISPRQSQVLRLIAEGKTNGEIADELVISLRTVERHVADVYAKIGARNRVEAAAFAMSHLLKA